MANLDKRNKNWYNSLTAEQKSDEIDLMLSINTKEQLKELAIEHGYDDKTIKDIFGKQANLQMVW